jgi:hypothetical protein
MNIILVSIILFLSISITILLIIFYHFYKKTPFINKKDKEFIEFTIDMYIQYSKELNIHSPQQHEKIIDQLSMIKNKYFKK